MLMLLELLQTVRGRRFITLCHVLQPALCAGTLPWSLLLSRILMLTLLELLQTMRGRRFITLCHVLQPATTAMGSRRAERGFSIMPSCTAPRLMVGMFRLRVVAW